MRTVCILRIKRNFLYDWKLVFVVNTGRSFCESISVKVCILKYRVYGPDIMIYSLETGSSIKSAYFSVKFFYEVGARVHDCVYSMFATAP
jgi:hypothetical protein